MEYVRTAYVSTTSRLASLLKSREITYDLLWALLTKYQKTHRSFVISLSISEIEIKVTVKEVSTRSSKEQGQQTGRVAIWMIPNPQSARLHCSGSWLIATGNAMFRRPSSAV